MDEEIVAPIVLMEPDEVNDDTVPVVEGVPVWEWGAVVEALGGTVVVDDALGGVVVARTSASVELWPGPLVGRVELDMERVVASGISSVVDLLVEVWDTSVEVVDEDGICGVVDEGVPDVDGVVVVALVLDETSVWVVVDVTRCVLEVSDTVVDDEARTDDVTSIVVDATVEDDVAVGDDNVAASWGNIMRPSGVQLGTRCCCSHLS